MGVLQQLGIVFLLMFLIPVIIIVVFYCLKKRKYTEEVEADIIDIRKVYFPMSLDYFYVPVYRFTYNYSTYEVESKNIRLEYHNMSFKNNHVKFKINPDDPTDINDQLNLGNIKYEHDKTEGLILGICAITAAIVTILVFTFY
ncbi:MAG: hypothetical protein E7262_08800 [Lachnospiraceae bacterium]|nr:hypothetical protein [Lachnospiraceae bacterium]